MLALDEMGDLSELADDRTVLLIFLYLRVLEVLDEVVETLQAGVGQVAYLHEGGGTFSERKRAHFFPWKRS